MFERLGDWQQVSRLYEIELETLHGDAPRERRLSLLDALATLRAGLRERMRRSPLCDGKQFTAELEAVYRDLWQRWARNPDAHP